MMPPHATTFFTAVVTATRVLKGRVVCDCQRMGMPTRTLTNVSVATLGGGPARGFVVPPAVGSQVILGQLADSSGRLSNFILGTWGDRSLGLSSAAQTSNPANSPADPAIDAQSIVLTNAEANLVIDGHGAIKLEPADGQPLRVELGGDGYVAIIGGSEEATDSAALTGPVVEALNEHAAAIRELQDKVAEILRAIAPGSVVGIPPTAIIPPAETASSVTDDTVGSAVLRLSPKSGS